MRSTFLIFVLNIVVLMLHPIYLFSQKDSIPGYYKDPTGKLFISPGTPVQLYMGVSPDGSKSVLLKSYPSGNSEIHWNSHGPVQLAYYNLFLGRNIRFDFFVDGVAPKSSFKIGANCNIEKNNAICTSGNGLIELNSLDPDAGTNTICYSLNSQTYQEYKNPIELKDTGLNSISVYAIDNVGNTEDEVTRFFYVDKTPPVTEIIFQEDNYNEVLSGRSKISFKTHDNLGTSKTYWSIDGGKETEYTKPIPTIALTEGEHFIRCHSVDLVNNVEEDKQFSFYVDKTPPMVFEEIIGNTYMVAGREYSSGRSQLKVAAVDNKAGVKEIYFALNNKDYQLYEKPVYLSEIVGSISVKSFASDNVNNKSVSSTESQVFTMPEIDITGPSITYNFIGSKLQLRDTIIVGPKTRIQVKATDSGSGVNRIVVKQKGEPEFNYIEPFSITTQGLHNITCSAFDNVENINLVNLSFFVDSKAPEIFYHFSTAPIRSLSNDGQTVNVYSSNTVLYLAATDNLSGIFNIEYSLNESKYTKYLQAIVGLKANSLNTIRIKATDLLGNERTEEITFRIE